MWPRPRGRGIDQRQRTPPEALTASMWPRPRGRGIQSEPAPSFGRRGRFNVATAARPWNLCNGVCTQPNSRGVNVSTAARPWNLAVEQHRRPPGAGFNVATAARPWNPRGWFSGPTATARFNVATAARPWNRPNSETPDSPARLLQCGHGRAAVESVTAGLSCGRGRNSFNVATPARPRNLRPASGPRRYLMSFNVPTAARPWNLGWHTWQEWRLLRFNVATAARPWNLKNRAYRARIASASMWPRPRGRGIVLGVAQIAADSDGLQCGHGRAAVESTRCFRGRVHGQRASMWPRPRGRGIPLVEPRSCMTTLLQCGHGRAAWNPLRR